MRLYEHRSGGTVDRARALRRHAPVPERGLFHAFREAFPHLKWRHEAPVDPYFADILCCSEKLVIEADGDIHGDAADHGARRIAIVERKGVRFTNADAVSNLDGVPACISLSLTERGRAFSQRGQGEGRQICEEGSAA